MTDKQSIYVVTADTLQGKWGTQIELFLVTDNKEKAEKKAKVLSDNRYFPEVTEVQLNSNTAKYLGGYVE